MKFYKVTISLNNYKEDTLFNENTHADIRVNENNLYTRANRFFNDSVKTGNFDTVSLIEVDSVSCEENEFAVFKK